LFEILFICIKVRNIIIVNIIYILLWNIKLLSFKKVKYFWFFFFVVSEKNKIFEKVKTFRNHEAVWIHSNGSPWRRCRHCVVLRCIIIYCCTPILLSLYMDVGTYLYSDENRNIIIFSDDRSSCAHTSIIICRAGVHIKKIV